MPVYKNCEVNDFVLHDNSPYEADVNITENSIVITYEYENVKAIWRGHQNGNGHYNLIKDGYPNSRATLHRFEGSKILEGYVIDEEFRGMWRFILGDF